MVDSESVFSLPPPLPVEGDSEPPPEEPSVHTYGPHSHVERYIRYTKWSFGIMASVILIVSLATPLVRLLMDETLSPLRFTDVFMPTLALSYGYIFLVHWPRYLRSQKVTLTDTHLRIERKVHRKQTLVVPRSSIYKVKLKDGMMYSRHALKYLHVHANDRRLPWHVRLYGGRIQLFGLDRPGHLRRQLLRLDASETDGRMETPAAVVSDPEKPTWTRHR